MNINNYANLLNNNESLKVQLACNHNNPDKNTVATYQNCTAGGCNFAHGTDGLGDFCNAGIDKYKNPYDKTGWTCCSIPEQQRLNHACAILTNDDSKKIVGMYGDNEFQNYTIDGAPMKGVLVGSPYDGTLAYMTDDYSMPGCNCNANPPYKTPDDSKYYYKWKNRRCQDSSGNTNSYYYPYDDQPVLLSSMNINNRDDVMSARDATVREGDDFVDVSIIKSVTDGLIPPNNTLKCCEYDGIGEKKQVNNKHSFMSSLIKDVDSVGKTAIGIVTGKAETELGMTIIDGGKALLKGSFKKSGKYLEDLFVDTAEDGMI